TSRHLTSRMRFISSFAGGVSSFTMAGEMRSSPATSYLWRPGASIITKISVPTLRSGACSMGRGVAKSAPHRGPDAERRSLRSPRHAEESPVPRRRRSHGGARHRGEHGDLRRGERGAAAPPAVRGAGPAGADRGEERQAESADLHRVRLELPVVARAGA